MPYMMTKYETYLDNCERGYDDKENPRSKDAFYEIQEKICMLPSSPSKVKATLEEKEDYYHLTILPMQVDRYWPMNNLPYESYKHHETSMVTAESVVWIKKDKVHLLDSVEALVIELI